ncbi:MAG: hypothetical protein QOC96_97 [Acidobacteriota bacterium]|nr:hypothetical protein [Acidobacteriota bacterium]
MYFSQAYPATGKAHSGNAFQLAPSSSAILLPQASTITNTCAKSDSLNFGYFANNLKVHCRTSCAVFICDSIKQHNSLNKLPTLDLFQLPDGFV